MIIVITKQVLKRNDLKFENVMRLHLTCNNYVLNAYSLFTFITFYFLRIRPKWAFNIGQTITKTFNLDEQTYDLNITYHRSAQGT
jgi:hypothetical protein